MSSFMDSLKKWIPAYRVKSHTIAGYTVKSRTVPAHTIKGYTVESHTVGGYDVKGHYRKATAKKAKPVAKPRTRKVYQPVQRRTRSTTAGERSTTENKKPKTLANDWKTYNRMAAQRALMRAKSGYEPPSRIKD